MPSRKIKMQFFLFLIVCSILAVASCHWCFFKEKGTDLKIMEEFLEVVNSEKKNDAVEKHEACQHLYTVVHWAFWFEPFVHGKNTKEIDEKYSKEKRAKNCCQKLQKFLQEKVDEEGEDGFKQFLKNTIQYVKSPENTRFGELLKQFTDQKKFEIEIAKEIYFLRKLEETKKKKFEKIKEKEKIKKLFDAENKKVEDFVGTIEKNLWNMYSLFVSIRECENLIANEGKNGNEKFEEVRGILDGRISELKRSKTFNVNIAQQLQTLTDAALEIHKKFSLETKTNPAVDAELNEKIKSASDAVEKIEEAVPRRYSDGGLKKKAYNLLSDIKDLVKLKKKMCECPAKIVEEKKEFEEKQKELGKEIHSFPVQLKKAEFYTECLPAQPEIERLHKMAVEEYNAGINLENEVFYESKHKLEDIFNNLLEIVKNAIASTFDYNCQFFDAAQKYLKKSILGTYWAIKQRKEMTSIVENLKEYSMEKHLLWRQMYGSFGNCHIGKFEKVEKSFKNEIQNLIKNSNDEAEFNKLITRSLRREFYKELGISEQNEIKIRITDQVHTYVIVGDFEYDYLQFDPPRRLLFNHVDDEKTAENSAKKAKPMKIPENQSGIKKYFTVEEADNVFFQLTKNGWNRSNYDHARRRFSARFAYEFVGALHAQHCPAKEVWPDNYVWVAENSPPELESVFGEDYERIHRDFQEEFNKTNQFEKCTIEDFHLQFEIDTAEIVDKEILEKLLPVTILYKTGKYLRTDLRNRVYLEELIEVQEFAQLDHENTDKIVYKTMLKAYACRVDYKLHAFIKELEIGNYQLFKIDQLDLYEENKELLHFKLDKEILQQHIPKEEEMKETESTVV